MKEDGTPHKREIKAIQRFMWGPLVIWTVLLFS